MYRVTPREDTAPQDVLDIAAALGWHDTLPENINEENACAYIEKVLDRVFDRLFHIKTYV
tara:strand:+ start:371 stop:550 length:180 start_codon:yes stop_codon:yes gene_type:complete